MKAVTEPPQIGPGTNDTLSVTDNRTGTTYEIPIENGAVHATELRKIRSGPEDFGLVSYDPGFLNTAACRSAITYIDGDKGILRYRGYPIEEIAEKKTFLEIAYLVLNGEFPTRSQADAWVFEITHHTFLHENIKKFI
ncbi:MAG TPA: citrate (Si)-synthase, partial [Chloroflexi bacterium]|nr:citrate (Si)-synthase [Chloroflexota bacterium]